MSQSVLSVRRRFAHLAILISLAALGAVSGDLRGGVPSQAQQPGPCDPPNSNPVVCENAKPGNPASEWDVSGAGDNTIQGFATDISVDQGQVIGFKIDTNATSYKLDIYRMGYYGGMGARLVTTIQPSVTLPQNQPNCLSDSTTGLIDCGNWAQSASWTVPADAVSGIYFAKVTRNDTGGASHIVFVVRDDDGRSDLLFQTSDTTWQAYNRYGGNSLYVGSPAGRAYKVSYNRPFTTRGTTPEDWVFNSEYPMVRWLEGNGYNVSYSTGVDTDRRGDELLEHKVFMSVGHDEYWSGNQRTKVEQARGAGVHLAFFSGNEIFWKTRWENSISASGTPYRTLVSYKETHANAKIDPLPNVWTGTWRDPRFSPPADGGRPENALSGTIFYVNSGTSSIRVPAAQGKLRFWRNTSVANLAAGTFADMPFGTLGYEWDEDRDNGFRPNGLIRLSDTTVGGVDYLQDYGSTYASGTANHALTLYKHASGALVFGAGTIQWSWGLDGAHDRGASTPSLAMQQATVNLFADMGANPLTPQGVTTANPSSDTLPPSSTITFPAHNSGVPANATITVTGTASDNGGGQVGGVEISLDGGVTWRRATGGASWSYTWQTGGARTVILVSRAVDDSGNLEQPTSGNSVTVGSGTVTCPCSIWTPSQNPAGSADNDPSAVELGTRFRSDVSGYVSAIRFYKSTQNTGVHIGNLWTANGTLLGTVTFSGESASGWQEASFPTPVAITANTSYVVSYHTDVGFYFGSDFYFAGQAVDNGPLHGLADGTDGPNGVYKYGVSGFPTQTYNSENYWVDVVFVTSLTDTTAPSVTTVSPADGASGVAANTALTAVFSENVVNVSSATFELRDSNNAVVPASVTYAAAVRTATLTPSSPLTYSTTYTARLKGGGGGIADAAGNTLAADVTWSFTTAAPPPPPPNEGPGGPILVIGAAVNPFGRYYAEILRAEGLNSFTATDITQVTASTLTAYDVVVLGEMTLTASQVTMFSDWVTAGGNLIAMRPDKKLASVLGLTDAAATLSEGYLLVNTAAAPGAGIVNQTMQFHGTADRYTLNGATAVATLYSNATTATSNPAVTMRSVGSSGGQVAAFTYDLARSIVLMRQGNPAWAGTERDGIAPIRSDDLFFGGSQADWIDLNKAAIPQADEQQRLLANMIGYMNSDRRPLPRFWYFPRGEKAAVVMTGDDHANNGTAGRFDIYKSDSPAGCNVDNWECVRATSYIFPNTPLSNAQVSAYRADGFEIGLHIRISGANPAPMDCNNYTASSIASDYSSQLAQFTSTFPGAGPVRTNRTHCIVWSDYDSQPQVALANGVRLDTNYYYWPGSWVQNRPGFMTGSGMPMRFAKADGTLIDVYQAHTHMTDESDQTWPFTIDTLLDRALGAEGYYGFFTANMHTDLAVHAGSGAIVASALARSVPVISAQQLLTWLDGRNGSSFSGISWNGNTLTFTIAVGTGANGLEAMIPTSVGASMLVGVSRGGSPLSYRVETVKGVNYAIFSAVGGSYQADYAVDSTPPTITGLSAAPSTTTATINWNTSEAADGRVDYGTAPDTLGLSTSSAALTSAHSVQLNGLSAATTYYYRVRSADAAGNAAVSPATPQPPASFVTNSVPTFNCPCTIWSSSQVPAVVTAQDSSAVELGVKFRTSVDGFITGIRFYKGPQNTGVHTGSLWSSTGALLATATFGAETPSGWQEVAFSQPVSVTPNTIYVASYHTNAGFYSADSAYFSTATLNAPLEALANGVSGGNGVYLYGTGGFPTDTFNSTNYWVDVVFSQTATPQRTISISDASVVEGDAGVANAVFNVTLNPASSTAVTVDFTTANGTATAGTDYTTTAGQLSFAPGVTTSTVTVPVTGDTATEGNETFLVTLSNPAGASLADGQATGTIIDDELPTLTVADISVTEGDTGNVNATFTVTVSASSGQTVSFSYATANGTATAPGDYATTTGTTTIPAGQTSVQITVPVVGDTIDEPNETFVLNLSGAVNATIADGSATATITDNDPPPSLTIGDVTVTESESAVNAVFTVTLSAASGQTVTASYSTANGTATAPGDYATASGSVTFAPGAVTQQISVTVAGDAVAESSETFMVTLSSPTNATVADPQAVGTIIDNDSVPVVNIADLAITETNVTTNAVFTVTLSAASGQSVTVNYATSNGTAVAPGDFTATSGTLTFAPGATNAQITVPVAGDLLDEADETFTVTLSAPTNATIADGLGLGTITDDDPTPSLSVADVAVNESSATITFTAVLSAASGQNVTVNYATGDGTALAPGDYGAASGTLTFTPGATSRTVAVSVVGDTLDENNETLFLNLSAPTNATIGDAQAQGTINDNDGTPSISIADVSSAEGNGGMTTVPVTVTLSTASGRTVTVNYALANGTATTADYTAGSGTLTFPAGTTAQSVNVPVTGDVLDENDETVFVNLSGASGATIADTRGVVTVLDDDAMPTVTISDVTVTEGNSGTTSAAFVVSLSAPSGRVITVTYATADGTAVAGVDYNAVTSGTLSFSVGATSRTASVAVRGDTLDELEEDFFVNLNGATNVTITDAQGRGAITDNDAPPAIAVNNVSVLEGNSGTATLTFTVTMNRATYQSVSVDFATSNGTATAGTTGTADYVGTSGTLTFAAGQTSQTITITVRSDTTVESNETVRLNLANAVNATIGDNLGIGTITNDD